MTTEGIERDFRRFFSLPSSALISAGLVLAAGAASLVRQGYSPDEEYTLFAVRGISAHGLPLLPSGLLYDRGLIYSYAGWLAGVVSGRELPAYRAVSLLAAIAALALLFATVRRLASAPAAWIAVALVATSMPFWVVATTARFYAPFLASYLGALSFLARLNAPPHPRPPSLAPDQPASFGAVSPKRPPAAEADTVAPWHRRTVLALAVLCAFCRFTHELAFTLAVVPLACLALSPPADRRLWLRATVAVVAGLAAAQAGLFALHFVAPQNGDTMIKRFFVWQVVNLFERPPALQIGVPVVAVVFGWLLAPRRAGLILTIGLCGVALVLGAAVSRAAVTAPLSMPLVLAALADASRYPLDMFWHLAHTMPVLLTAVLLALVVRLCGGAGPWVPAERAIHAGWIGWVLWFGVIESGITINYVLLPVTLMLAAVAVDFDAIVRARFCEARRVAGTVAIALVAAAVVADQWRGEGSPGAQLAAARPTISVPGFDAVRASLTPTDRVACTDELACLLLVGRADAWLALDDYVRERFVVQRGGAAFGVYTGAPALFHPADLFSIDTGPRPARVLVVDVFKDYPAGNSIAWLPRAIEEDGLDSRTLLETAQARVVEISRPAQNAMLQPSRKGDRVN